MRDRAATDEPSVAEPARASARTPGRAAEILTLQRTIGNAATGRWLARQDAVTDPLESAWANVCAIKVPATPGPPQRLDAADPKIDTVAGPCLTHWAGGYHWFVRYRLLHPAPASGHIIQELWQVGSGGSREHFWEYWSVASGAVSPPDPTPTPAEASPAGVPYDDRYVHGVLPGGMHDRTGWYRHVGVARFYPGPLPRQFVGARRFTYDMPDGWVAGAGTRHDCYAQWSREPGQPRRLGLVAFAGSDEFRAGDPVTAPPFTP